MHTPAFDSLPNQTNNVIEVEKIDAFDGTPVLDIKPYAPGQDSAAEVRVPDWAKQR